MNEVQLDLLIIGAGPAGLSAADVAAQEGLSYLVVEKGLIADTVYHYPVGLTVFSTVNELEMREGTLKPCREKPTREELLSHYVQFALERGLKINTEEEVVQVAGTEAEGFMAETTRASYRARRVLFATGAMARPRRLGVAGEDLPKVHYRFAEPFPYVRKQALVIGGGNSAAEAALFLAEHGAHTSLAIWRADWENLDPKKGAIKHWVRTPIESVIAQGRLELIFFKAIEEIREREVVILREDDEEIHLPNDVVFVLVGSEADFTLMRQLGIETVASGLTSIPVYDAETFETNVRGVYVAGHFTHARHIKEAIAVPRRIVPLIAKELRGEKQSV